LSDEVVDALRGVLLNPQLDPAFISEVLTIPSHNEVSGWFEVVNVDAIAAVLKGIKLQLATELVDELSATYHSLVQHDYDISHDSIAKRALRNLCLGYLAYLPGNGHLVKAHYENANNMTDKTAALHAANSAGLAQRAELMDRFSSEWSDDGLVMDKWFMLQGANPSSNALEGIKQSMEHKAFSLKNPNRTRSLMGSFFNANPVNFHAKDGSGYAFAGEIIAKMNEINPQVASRLIDPLLKFKRFDDSRQQLMKSELEKLRKLDNLAADLFEKVTSALA
jgi:aminopeptidase N